MRNTFLAVALGVTVLAGIAVPVSAQQPLTLDFQNGLVTVEATNVPLRTILTEWERRGGTKIVGAERITASPLTVKLVNVAEAKALDVILLSVAGYMAAPRSVPGAGPSMYDRILVMATSTPAPAATTRPQPTQPNGAQRFTPPRQQQPDQEEQDEPDENPPSPPNPPVFTFPQPGQQGGFGQPGQFNGTPAGQPGQNVITVNPANGGAPQGITINPSTAPGQPTAPGAPIGVSTPGMMVQPQQPTPPGMIRPPGQQQRQQ